LGRPFCFSLRNKFPQKPATEMLVLKGTQEENVIGVDKSETNNLKKL